MSVVPVINDSREDENRSSVIVAPSFDIGVGQKEDGKDNRDDIPSRKDQSAMLALRPLESGQLT